MIKTSAIIFAATASLGANTATPPAPKAPAHFEITAGPLNILREDGATRYKFDPASDSLLRVKLASGKTLSIKL